MTTLADVRGGSVQGDAIRIARLDASGAPLSGATSMIQTDNLVKLDFSHDVQAGADITTVDAQGRACMVYRGRDTIKRGTYTLQICDMDLLIHEMAIGGTLFTDSGDRTVNDAATATDTSLVSATAAFTDDDIGATVSGTGIFAGSTIISRESATHVTLSHATTATASGVTVTITDVPMVVGYQPPKVGVIGCPNGISVEVWSKRILHDFQVGWWHWAFPRMFLNENTDRSIGNNDMAMSFVGWGNENPNWGTGPGDDFDHDSSGLWQVLIADALPTPLQDGYQAVT